MFAFQSVPNMFAFLSVYKQQFRLQFLKFDLLICWQEPIDIFAGLTDEQAMRMADNLKFKGDLQKEVFGL